MRARSLLLGIVSFATLGLVACGGSNPPPANPPAPAAENPPAPPPVAEEKKEEPPPPPPPPPPPKKAAKDVLMADGAVFMFSLDDSADAKAAVTAECEKKYKKNAKKKDDCIAGRTSAAAGRGLRFEKDAKGNYWFVTFATKGGGAKEVVTNKFAVKVASADADKVTLTPEGKDKGRKPWRKLPAELVVEVPDESTASFVDPKEGKLVYKLKK